MPASLLLLEASSKLGATLSDLLNPDVALAGVTDGAIDVSLLKFGVLSRVDEKPLKPNDLALTAGWGHRTKKGIVMPGSGRIKERHQYTEGELAGLNEKDLQVLGPPIDIMLNDVASLRTIPANVWRFRIGGYQVIKKWLSYREESVLGRSLTKDEAREITYMVRRISAIVLMTSKLNANYVAVRDNSFAWSHAAKAGA